MTAPAALPQAVERAIARLRAGDPLRPVHVVVPQRLLGDWLGRCVFESTGHVAVHFDTPEDLAWRVLEPALGPEGWRPAPPLAELALLLAELREAAADPELPEYLGRALGTRGFATAAQRSLEDLEAAAVSPDTLDAAAGDAAAPERLRLLARLARGRQARLGGARLLSGTALLRRAATAAPGPDLGAVVVADTDTASPALHAMAAGLARHVPLVWLRDERPPDVAPRHTRRQAELRQALPPETRPEPDPHPAPASALERVQHGLFGPIRTGAPTPLDASLVLLAASGESLEAVEIARRIGDAAAEGVPWGEMAVLLRGPSSQAIALDTAFDRAGIEAFFFEGAPRVDAPARALSLLLDLPASDYDRARVMEFLTTARVPWEALLGEGAELSAARWDRLSARAGIVAGLDQWRRGLDRAEENARATADRYDREPDEDRDVRLIESLRRVIERLAADLADLPEEAGWDVHLKATLTLLATWVSDSGRLAERLERALAPLAAYAPAPSCAEFVSRLQDLLAAPSRGRGDLGSGVFVGSIENARGLAFRLVFVPQLAERRFPAPVRPDPLLLDDERRALSPALRTTEDGLERDRRLFHAAVTAARERLVLSYPRVDAAGRETVPSTFLLRAAEAAVGRRLTSRGLLEIAEAGETLLGRAWPEDPARALDRLEHDLSLVAGGAPGAAAHLLDEAPHLARATAAAAAEWEPALTAWDGVLDRDDEAVAAWLEGLRPWGRGSHTRLKSFASCPYRRFLETGLRLREWDEPGRGHQVDALVTGNLYHQAYERTFRALRDKGALPLAHDRLDDARDEARRAIETVLDEAAAEGVVVHRDLLGPLEVDMVRDLDETLLAEATDADGWVPVDFEQEFRDVRIGYGEGREVVLGGILDRVDFAEDPARVRVLDWKTGRFRFEEDAEFEGGREFQLVLYNAAAETLYPEREVSEAVYRFATEKGRFSEKACPNSPEKRETLGRILENLDALARSGVFAPTADSCMFCSFVEICGPHRERRAERKAADPRLAPFRRLREIP